VSLLLDENLSPRLLRRLSSLFPEMVHVRDVGLKQASDEVIWEWAGKKNYTIVTTDADFAELSQRLGWPPKVIHLEECDFPLRTIEELLRRNAVRISEFEKDPGTGLLSVRFPSDRGFR
jgi:predicted nuclease of predicted toxin-antitoxin system